MAITPHASRTFPLSPAPGEIPKVRIAVGDTEHIAFDVTDLLVTGDSVTGVPAWASSATGVATTGGELFADSLAKASITGVAEGQALMTCTITMAIGRVYKRSVAVIVRTPA